MGSSTPVIDVRKFYMPFVAEKLTSLYQGQAIDYFKFEYHDTGQVRCLSVTLESKQVIDIEFAYDPTSGLMSGCTVATYPLVDVPVLEKP